MSWKQDLVNADMELNRCVFEMNRPGHLKTDVCYKEKADLNYIKEHMREALKDLQSALKKIDNTLF